jgi:type II secretory pathway pseudopilin PulG
MDELAKRQGLDAAQQQTNATNWAAQQRANELAWAEQQRLNALKNQQQIAANQKAYDAYLANQAKLAAEQATKTTGFQTSAGTTPFANATQGFAQNFQNYQSIAPGAQYNPAVMAGGASPYSLIMGQMKPMGNPYAGVVAGQAMGGYNPGLYDQIAAANLAKTEAETAATTAAQNTQQESTGMAQGGMVHGGVMFGANPPGPDDGAVNLDLGEYVIKKSSVNKYGRGLLDMINEGKVPAKKMKSLLG